MQKKRKNKDKKVLVEIKNREQKMINRCKQINRNHGYKKIQNNLQKS